MKLIVHALVLVALCTLGLCGCVTAGSKSLDDPKKFLNIREGVSTKDDVYTAFGQPHDVDYSRDRSQSLWTYYKVEASPTAVSYVPYLGILAGGTNKDIKKVYFFFGPDGKLIRMQTAASSDSTNSWVG